MSDWQDPNEDEEGDEWAAAELSDAELTGKEARFVNIGSMDPALVDLTTLKVDELISTYIFARNQLATDHKGWKAREAAVKLHMSTISMLLRDKGDTAGVDSFATSQGTAYRKKSTKIRVGDWDVCSKYVLESGNIHILQKRVSPNACKEIQEQTGEYPPGLEVIPEEEFAVRSPTTRAKKS